MRAGAAGSQWAKRRGVPESPADRRKRRHNAGMDAKDRSLVTLLRANARESTASLARKLGVARSTVQERITKLEKDGTIAGYTVRVAHEVSDRQIAAQVLMKVNPKKMEKVMRELKAIPFVRGVYALSGGYDYLAKIEGESTRQIDGVLDAIGAIEGIESTQTSVVLSVKFER
jgi:DNA-binding Lrp family transcriptional regulator